VNEELNSTGIADFSHRRFNASRVKAYFKVMIAIVWKDLTA